jgi:hypothetical protein
MSKHVSRCGSSDPVFAPRGEKRNAPKQRGPTASAKVTLRITRRRRELRWNTLSNPVKLWVLNGLAYIHLQPRPLVGVGQLNIGANEPQTCQFGRW